MRPDGLDKITADTMRDMNRVIDNLRRALRDIRDAPVSISTAWCRDRADAALANERTRT